MLWMCIWMYPHQVMAANVDQAFGILLQIWASLSWYVMVNWGDWKSISTWDAASLHSLTWTCRQYLFSRDPWAGAFDKLEPLHSLSLSGAKHFHIVFWLPNPLSRGTLMTSTRGCSQTDPINGGRYSAAAADVSDSRMMASLSSSDEESKVKPENWQKNN